MGKAGRIVGTFLVTIILIVIINFVIVPALIAPHQQIIAKCDQKMQLLDKAALANDKGDQLSYDTYMQQADQITGC
jgi:hypothetical protein